MGHTVTVLSRVIPRVIEGNLRQSQPLWAPLIWLPVKLLEGNPSGSCLLPLSQPHGNGGFSPLIRLRSASWKAEKMAIHTYVVGDFPQAPSLRIFAGRGPAGSWCSHIPFRAVLSWSPDSCPTRRGKSATIVFFTGNKCFYGRRRGEQRRKQLSCDYWYVPMVEIEFNPFIFLRENKSLERLNNMTKIIMIPSSQVKFGPWSSDSWVHAHFKNTTLFLDF